MIFRKAEELRSEGISFVTITMTGVKGSAPQILGAKCIVTKNGLEYGTVGGGKVEAAAIKKGIEILRSPDSPVLESVSWNLQKDIKMTCGGVVDFLFEKFTSRPWSIAIFGAGHVSQALTRVLSKLDCQVTVIDDRQEWLEKLPSVKVIKTNNPVDALSHFDENTYFISMTKGHATDVPFLSEVYRQFPNSPYIGAIGSDTKAIAIKRDLKDLGVTDEFLDKIFIPIGLPIGNNTPEEIAISITAQLLQVRS